MFSWPKDDPSQWNSEDAACRCAIYPDESFPPVVYEPLVVDVDGVDTTLYVQYPAAWSQRSPDDDDHTVSFDYNNRMYLSTQQEIDRDAFFTPNMLGGSIEYDVDLSKVGCGCVTAIYSVLMPAVDSPQNAFPFGYCDANKVGGYWCPEFDIMEANKFGFRSTGHSCDAPDALGVYHNCDRVGQCSIDVHTNNLEHDFEPGSTNGIDTDQEFHVRIEFHKDAAEKFNGYTVTLTQGTDRRVELASTDCSYLNAMTDDLTRMAFTLSNWG